MSMPECGLLDTSTVILLGRITDPTLLPDEPVISAITLAELSVGPLITDDSDERAGRQAHLQLAESDFDPLPFDAAAARAFGPIAAELRRESITKLEERAHKLGAKLTIPMVLFMLPAMFIILGASPFLHLMDAFSGFK